MPTVLLFSATALAQEPVDDDSSAVDQYVEDVPASEGSTPAAAGGAKKPPPPSSQPATQPSAPAGDGEAALVEEIATSPTYGAPQKKLRPVPTPRLDAREPHAGGGGAESTPLEPLSAAVSAVQGGDVGRLAGLLAVCFLISVAAVVGAMRRQRRTPT